MVLPSFNVQGGALLCAARGIAVGGLLSVFGTLAFRLLVAPPALARMETATSAAIRNRLLVLGRISVLVSLLGSVAWLLVQSADMADAGSLTAVFTAVPAVLEKTSFGHILLAQCAMLAGLALLLGGREREWRQRTAFAAATLAVALQAGHSHAFSMYDGPSFLLLADVLHLLGAGGWLGGLPPLLLLIAGAPPRAGATAALRFSPWGRICIGALVISAAFQDWVLVASIPGIIGTAYGWMVLMKMVLFAILLGFACANRYRFAPALWRDNPTPAKAVLQRSIMVQTGFAMAIVTAAVVLTELPPAMHEQALWPFPDIISLAAVREDPDFLREVLQAGLALGFGLALLAGSLAVRRFRLFALGLSAIIAWFAVPHLDLLLVTATPTSFYRSPTNFAAETIVQGSTVFAQNCVSCHGASGAGDGPAATSLPTPPANLTTAHLWMHKDGELFWWITHGMQTPEGGTAMPGLGGVLDADQVWAVIDYIHAHNAGNTQKTAGIWSPPVRAPAFQAQCGAEDRSLADMHGSFVRLVIGDPPKLLNDPGIVTVVAGDATLPAGTCITRDENVPLAYAIIAGVDKTAGAGMQFLIDGNGWLRAMQAPAAPMNWNEPNMLQAELQRLRAHPVIQAMDTMTNMKM